MSVGHAWGGIRGLVREAFTFAQIKDLVGGAGLPVERLAHLRQHAGGGASKGQLIDGIEALFQDVESDDRDRLVVRCVRVLLERDPAHRDDVDAALQGVGWGLVGGEPQPIALQLDVDLVVLPEAAQDGLRTALRRYRDGDLDGAVTAICGVVDSLTAAAYEQHGLGNHVNASYQERVARSFATKESAYKAPLEAQGMPRGDVERLWHNQRGAVNQAAFVLAALRSRFSDAHGGQATPPEVVQRALDVGVFVTRSLLGS